MTQVIHRLRNAKILIIDDNRGDILLTQLAFKRGGMLIDIETANCAEHGLSILRGEGDHAARSRPDIILCDLNLPQMSGIGFLNVVKGDPLLRRIPVLILSSSSSEKDVEDSYDALASGYLTKPYSVEGFDNLVAMVEHYWFGLVHSPRDVSGALLEAGIDGHVGGLRTRI